MIEAVYKDKYVLAVNKPPGMVVFNEQNSPSKEKSVASILSSSFPELKEVDRVRCGAVHRLDKDTSGILLFARDKATLSSLQKELLEQNAKKRYIALVFKPVKKNCGEIRTFMKRSPKDRRKQGSYTEGGGREAVTIFRVLKTFSNYSLLEVFPRTGRKHQIRCHLSYIGHPVAGDKLYRFKDQTDPKELERQFLHAKSIEIKTPLGKKKLHAKLPTDLKKIIQNLKKNVY